MCTAEDTQTQSVNQVLATVSETDGKYLTFWTDKQLYGVPIRDVIRIVGIQPITEIPGFPAYAKGIINLRGSIIALIDLRLRFGKQEIAHTDRTCVIIASIRGREIGFIVDEVNEVAQIDDQNISIPPSLSGKQADDFLTGIARQRNQVALLLDTVKLLTEDLVDALASL